MSSINLHAAEKAIKNTLRKDWSKISFESEYKDDIFSVTADLTLRNHDDGIRVIYTVSTGGMMRFRAVFDHLDMTMETLKLVNDMNHDSSFFSAFIRNDKYFELQCAAPIYDVKDTGEYLSECMYRLSKMSDNKVLQQITRLTY